MTIIVCLFIVQRTDWCEFSECLCVCHCGGAGDCCQWPDPDSDAMVTMNNVHIWMSNKRGDTLWSLNSLHICDWGRRLSSAFGCNVSINCLCTILLLMHTIGFIFPLFRRSICVKLWWPVDWARISLKAARSTSHRAAWSCKYWTSAMCQRPRRIRSQSRRHDCCSSIWPMVKRCVRAWKWSTFQPSAWIQRPAPKWWLRIP